MYIKSYTERPHPEVVMSLARKLAIISSVARSLIGVASTLLIIDLSGNIDG